MSEQENLEITKGALDALSAGDSDRFASYFAEAAEWGGDAFPSTASGREAIQQLGQGYVDAFAVRFEIERQVASGDTVMTCYRYRGTHQGEYQGVAPTNQQVEGAVCAVSEIQNGKIVQRTEYWDEATLLQQIGVDIAAAQAKS